MRAFIIATLLLFLILHLLAPPALAQDTPVCAVCGEKVSGDFFGTEGQYYHSKCFLCDYCGKSIPDAFIRYQEKNYHPACFEDHAALRCDVCGGIIKGKYISNFWGNAYHPEHEGKEIQCSFCRRFIVGNLLDETIIFQDGWHLCGECISTAVFESAEAVLLLREVAKQLADFGLTVDPRLIEVNLVNKDALRRLAKGASQDTWGFVNFEVTRNMNGSVTRRSIRMYLLYGMPRTEMIGAIAHELTHVWLFLQAGDDSDKVLAEGSCNYSAYLILQKTENDQAKFIIDNMQNNPDAVYGEGFRRIKRYVEANGLESWRRLMKENPQQASF
jgi:hypothetical protein